MKSISNDYKTQIKEFGREIDAKILYTIDNEDIELGAEELNSVSLHYEGNILKSVMKQLDIDSNVDIPLETQINAKFGLKVNGTYEYITLGNFIVYSSEKQEDLNSYKIVCYDKMLYAMKDYEDLSITYPITIRSYINTICTHLGLTFANSSDTFVNYNKEIPSELYLDASGESLNYTYRDVLDQLAEVTASTICINDDDELEIRYINNTEKNLFDKDNTRNGYRLGGDGSYYADANYSASEFIKVKPNTFYTRNKYLNIMAPICTYDVNQIFIERITSGSTITTPNNCYYIKTAVLNTDLDSTMLNEGNTILPYEPYNNNAIDEEYLKDVNVNFGEKFGPVNTITFKRSADADVISKSIPENLSDDLKVEIAISDNQILNSNNRDAFIDEILNKLYGLEYYTNDYKSTGITFYDLCDKYNVQIDNTTYPCIMLNDEINITSGLEELIHTDKPKDSTTDYQTASKTDRTRTRAELIVDKVNGQIDALVSTTDSLDDRLDTAEAKITSQGLTLDLKTQKIDNNGNTTSFETDGVVYELTSDATFQEDKTYYTKINDYEYRVAEVVVGDTIPANTYYESNTDALTHYELNANGFLTEDRLTGYKAYRKSTGDYYYENDTMTGKYTKDGAVFKDLGLYGKYYYGINEEDPTFNVETFTRDNAKFVGQLYIDDDDEEGFGHFSNES